MKLREEELTIYDLLRRKDLGQINFLDQNTLPAQENQNKMLESLLLGVPLCLKGIRSKNAKISIMDTNFNVLFYFFNGNINFKSTIFTEGFPFDKDQIDKELLERIFSIKVKILTFNIKDESKIIKEYFENKYSEKEINEMKEV